MDKYRLLALLVVSLIFLAGTLTLTYSESSEEYYMLNLINNERQANGLSPLTMNSALSSAARAHSLDMINRSFFNHVNPDGSSPSDRAKNAGYTFIALGENICGNPSIDAGHSSLMGSPAHRANILNPSFKEVGIGIVDGGPYGKMITQLFGAQPGESITPSSQNTQESEGKPDIIVEGINVSGKSEVGNQITMKITLSNVGKKNAGSFIFAIFDGNPDGGRLLGKSNVTSLYVGYKVNATLTWTPQTSGNYTIYFVPDFENSVVEENENNNISTYTISVSNSSQNPSSGQTNNPNNNQENTQIVMEYKPDLSISTNELSYQSAIYVNTSSNAYFRVKNTGKSTAYGIPIKVYVNGNYKTSSIIPQIQPSSFNDFNIFLTFTVPGEYTIEAIVDPDNTIDEISKSNNGVIFKVKVIEKNTNSNNVENQKIGNSTKFVDLLIYPYYIILEEQANGELLIKAKIKNKGDIGVEDAYVSFYERDLNNSDRLIEKVPISLYPNEILEKSIIFSPLNKDGEIIVVIDEENKIKESDEGNNIATKLFSVKGRDSNLSATNAQIINTTPQEANISNYLRITIQIKDINASNSYLYYNQDINRTFTKLRMNSEGNGSYFIDIDPLGKENIEYYFEIDTGTRSIISPIYAPNELYITKIKYQIKNESKEDNSLIGNIKKIFSNIF